MDAEKLKTLVDRYPEVGQLLKDNYSLSVAVLAARMDAHQQKMEGRLDVFDRNHTSAQGRLADRVQHLEERLEAAAKFNAGLLSRLKKLEASNGHSGE